LATSLIRVLVVDDSEGFRRFVCSTVQRIPNMRIISEVSDGLEAVRKAEKLQPDLILLDIGLPSMNGIEAARQIRKLSPESKILFISQESSMDLVYETLLLGARGYVFKTDAGTELVTAVKAILRDERFVSSRFGSSDSTKLSGQPVSKGSQRISEFILRNQQSKEFAHHEAFFYSDDESFLDHVSPFYWGCSEGRGCSHRHRNRVTPRQRSCKVAGIRCEGWCRDCGGQIFAAGCC
jgi:DNA-binding NarL/FixJ family response regulator